MRVKAGAPVEVVNEENYTFGSMDNVRVYTKEVILDDTYQPNSVHGILINSYPDAVFGASGGVTGVHDNSAILLNHALYLAIGNFVVSYDLAEKELRWAKIMDEATCFGIYYEPAISAFFCHGELQISRFDSNGGILWQKGGRDIFTGPFFLDDQRITVFDFNDIEYTFSYEG